MMEFTLKKLGIIAGSGSLPRKIVDLCITNNIPFHVICLEGHCDPNLYHDCSFDIVRIGAAGKSIKILKKNNVKEIIMAGPVKRPNFSSVRPDTVGLKFLLKSGALKKGDDGLLSSLIHFLELEHGFKVIGLSDLFNDTVHNEGALGKIKPDKVAWEDIQKANNILQLIAEADIGQGLVIQEGLVLAVEAIEGTDSMLKRCAELIRPGPAPILVKIRKKDQEERADLPTIGLKTIENLSKNGLRGLAFDAGGMVIMDKEEVIKKANEMNIFLYSFDPDKR